MADRTGRVILSKGIKLDRQYKNIVDYTESQMVTLCSNNKVYESNNCSIIKENEVLELDVTYGDALKCNYLAFQNPHYSSKWFFAFINRCEYVSEKCTRIYFSIDELSTWRDYWDIKPCFVVREHVNDDTIGANTVPENLECGEYEIVDLRYASMYETSSPSTDFSIVFCVTELPTQNVDNIVDGRVKGDLGYIGGVFSSLIFFAVRTSTGAAKIIEAYENDPDTSTDSIKNIYVVPNCCVNETVTQPTHYHPSGFDIYMYPLYNYYQSDEFTLQQPSVLSGNFTPKNNKLFTYPYSYFFVTNNSGESLDYRYEDFPLVSNVRTIKYKKYLVPSTSVSGKLVFTNYKSYSSTSDYQTKLNAYGISYGKIPVCAWITDYYTNWLTQNGVNIALDFLKAGTLTALGLATGGIGAAVGVATGVSTILDAVSRDQQQSMIPPQSHGDVNTGDYTFCFSRNIISFYEMSVRPEFAHIIDEYFTRNGYKINRLKVPNETGRTYWNYVQISNESSIGTTKSTISVPTNSMDTINNAYRAGLTIWHNHDNIGNYTLNNTIVTP